MTLNGEGTGRPRSSGRRAASASRPSSPSRSSGRSRTASGSSFRSSGLLLARLRRTRACGSGRPRSRSRISAHSPLRHRRPGPRDRASRTSSCGFRRSRASSVSAPARPGSTSPARRLEAAGQRSRGTASRGFPDATSGPFRALCRESARAVPADARGARGGRHRSSRPGGAASSAFRWRSCSAACTTRSRPRSRSASSRSTRRSPRPTSTSRAGSAFSKSRSATPSRRTWNAWSGFASTSADRAAIRVDANLGYSIEQTLAFFARTAPARRRVRRAARAARDVRPGPRPARGWRARIAADESVHGEKRRPGAGGASRGARLRHLQHQADEVRRHLAGAPHRRDRGDGRDRA